MPECPACNLPLVNGYCRQCGYYPPPDLKATAAAQDETESGWNDAIRADLGS